MLRQIGRVHALLHPDLGFDAREQQMIPDGMWQHPDRRLAGGQFALRQMFQKGFVFHLAQGQHQAVAAGHDGIGAGYPLFSNQRRTLRDLLFARGCFRPSLSHVHQVVFDLRQQRNAVCIARLGPRVFGRVQRFQCSIVFIHECGNH